MQTSDESAHCEHARKRQKLAYSREAAGLRAHHVQEHDCLHRYYRDESRQRPRKYPPPPSRPAPLSVSRVQLPSPSPLLSSFLSPSNAPKECEKGLQSKNAVAEARSMWSLGSDLPPSQHMDHNISSKLASSHGKTDTDTNSNTDTWAGTNVTNSPAQHALAFHPNITVTPYISSSSIADEIVPCSFSDAISFADRIIPTIAAHWDLEDFRRMAVAPVRLSGRATVLIMGPMRAQNRAKLHAFATLVRDVLQDTGLLWKWEVIVCEAEILVRQC